MRIEVPSAQLDALSDEQRIWCAGSSGSDDQAIDDVASLVRDAVASALSAQQRAIVEAYFFEGLSQSDIASRLGIRQQVVHRHLYGTTRNGRRVGGALSRLRGVLSPLVAR